MRGCLQWRLLSLEECPPLHDGSGYPVYYRLWLPQDREEECPPLHDGSGYPVYYRLWLPQDREGQKREGCYRSNIMTGLLQRCELLRYGVRYKSTNTSFSDMKSGREYTSLEERSGLGYIGVFLERALGFFGGMCLGVLGVCLGALGVCLSVFESVGVCLGVCWDVFVGFGGVFGDLEGIWCVFAMF
ncbi:hypothetical protein E2C01_051054 [Portunus trituberculatus]|uniref:Uncharacterized protein n=1 Tax=Portunus trituberculatus TaxID=210409 RepID=A0A5B7GAK3_PORTR|nr:hypothetical protein [Portunus trituberculatus]